MKDVGRGPQMKMKVPVKAAPAPSRKCPPPPNPTVTVSLNPDEFDDEDDMMIDVILTGVVWPPPANPKSGHRYYVSVEKSWCPPAIYSAGALQAAVERTTGINKPWTAGGKGDGHGFADLDEAISFFKAKFPRRRGVKLLWA